MEVLKVEDICINFGGVVAADHVSFSVSEGEIVGLIGPNGAGKTTVLNLISGLLTPNSGKVYFDGKDVTGIADYKRARMGLARTFQTPHLLRKSTLRDNLKLGMDLGDKTGMISSFFGKEKSDFREEVAEYTRIIGISVNMNDDPSSLPYGQLKQLEIIRAMLSHPKIMLIDEPAAGLNADELKASVRLIRHAVRSGIGVVLIEHRMDMIMQVCHKIVVLNFGKVIAHGTPEEVSSDEKVIEAYLGRDMNVTD